MYLPKSRFNVHIFFNKTRPILLVLPWFGLIFQTIITLDYTNLNYSFIAASVSTIFILYLYQPCQWYKFPLSSLTLLGYFVIHALGPLFFTAFEKRPISYNLVELDTLFIHITLCSAILIFSHALYCSSSCLQSIRKSITKINSNYFNVFHEINQSTVVAIGSIGLISMIYVYWFNRDINTTIVKFAQGLILFSYIPLTLLLKPMYSRSKKVLLSDWIINIIFLFLIIISALGRNSRAAFANPIATYVIGIILMWIYQKIKVSYKVIIFFMLLLLFVVPIVSNLAESMVLVRSMRGDIPAQELILETSLKFSDQESIEKLRLKKQKEDRNGWDVSYVSNPFLSRFVNLKFADNSLALEKKLSQESRNDFLQFTIDRLVTMFPSPIMSFFGVSQELKQEVLSVSWGDQLLYLVTNNRDVLGGLRVGHFVGTGLAAFGNLYFILLFILSIPLYILVDSMVLVNSNSNANPIYSPIALANLYGYFVLFNASSIVAFITFVSRDWIELVILYAILLKVVNKFEDFFVSS